MTFQNDVVGEFTFSQQADTTYINVAAVKQIDTKNDRWMRKGLQIKACDDYSSAHALLASSSRQHFLCTLVVSGSTSPFAGALEQCLAPSS